MNFRQHHKDLEILRKCHDRTNCERSKRDPNCWLFMISITYTPNAYRKGKAHLRSRGNPKETTMCILYRHGHTYEVISCYLTVCFNRKDQWKTNSIHFHLNNAMISLLINLQDFLVGSWWKKWKTSQTKSCFCWDIICVQGKLPSDRLVKVKQSKYWFFTIFNWPCYRSCCRK